MTMRRDLVFVFIFFGGKLKGVASGKSICLAGDGLEIDFK